MSFASRSEHVGESNIPEYLLSDTNIIQPDRDEPRGIKSPRKARGGFVVEADPAEIKHQFRVLDNLPRLLRGHRSRIQPANCGWLSSMMHFSIVVVANGQPSASIACRPPSVSGDAIV